MSALPDGRPPLPEPLPHPVVDTHCHLDLASRHDDERDPGLDVDAAVEAAAAVGVTRIVQVGCDLAGARWSVRLAHEVPTVVATVALHPNEAPRLHERGGEALLAEALAEIEELAADPRVRAVGETGLDRFRTGPEGFEVQERSFREHLAIAARQGKPVVIHDREAHDDVVRVLLDTPRLPPAVVFHCFSGDAALARTCAEHGWYVSVAGTVTFKNADALREAVAVVPPHLLLVETDAPYLTPVPFRGRPNASYLVPLTVGGIAAAQGRDVTQVAKSLWDNAFEVFGAF